MIRLTLPSADANGMFTTTEVPERRLCRQVYLIVRDCINHSYNPGICRHYIEETT